MSEITPAAPRAWVVQDGSEEWSEIVYATTRNQARLKGACIGDSEYFDTSARRAPEWDALAPKGPTQEQLFNAGWWFECDCGLTAVKASGAAFENRAPVCETCLELRKAPLAEPGPTSARQEP